jgi:hypothetical protein
VDVTENGPTFEGTTKVKRAVCDTVSCCKEALREMKVQATLDAFSKKGADSYSQNESQ